MGMPQNFYKIIRVQIKLNMDNGQSVNEHAPENNIQFKMKFQSGNGQPVHEHAPKFLSLIWAMGSQSMSIPSLQMKF